MASSVLVSRVFNLLAFILILIVNILGYFLPIGNRSIGQGYQSVISPYPWAFVIWALIYFSMLVFIIYQLFPSTYFYDYINKGITPLFVLQALANVGWIFAQAYAPPDLAWIELIFIYLLFICLFLMYTNVTRIIKRDLVTASNSDERYYANYFFGRFWLSVYFGWITIATCIISFAVLSDLSLSSYINGSIVFGALGLLALIMLAFNRDVVFALTLVWAAIWIAINFSTSNQDNQAPEWPMFLSAIITGAVVLVASVIAFIINIFFCLSRTVHRRKHHAESTTEVLRDPVP